jgi:hypothetical protein
LCVVLRAWCIEKCLYRVHPEVCWSLTWLCLVLLLGASVCSTCCMLLPGTATVSRSDLVYNSSAWQLHQQRVCAASMGCFRCRRVGRCCYKLPR